VQHALADAQLCIELNGGVVRQVGLCFCVCVLILEGLPEDGKQVSNQIDIA
jgi:hypothetical protein